MATNLILQFPGDSLNTSVQNGDFIYYVPTTTQGTVTPFQTGSIANVVQLGPIINIDTSTNQLTVLWDDSDNDGDLLPDIPQPTNNDFIMFGKNKNVNTSSLVGYYAEVKLVNNSTEKAELFSLGSEMFESSR